MTRCWCAPSLLLHAEIALWNLFSSVEVLEVSLLEAGSSRPSLVPCELSVVSTRSESLDDLAVAADKSMVVFNLLHVEVNGRRWLAV